MSKATSKPVKPSVTDTPQGLRRVVSDLGQEHIRPGALGLGPLTHGSTTGAHGSVIVDVPLSGPGTYDVPHSLGEVPVHVELLFVTSNANSTPTPHAKESPVRREEWTSSTARMDIVQVAGSLTNCTAKFRVWRA